MGDVVRFEKKKRRRPLDALPRDAPETEIQNAIRSAVCRLPYARLWRNNTGCLKDERGRYVSYGLAIGSADLIGLVAPVDGSAARWLAIEVKRNKENASVEQVVWLAAVRKLRGVAGVARSVFDALSLVAEARGVHPDIVVRELNGILGGEVLP